MTPSDIIRAWKDPQLPRQLARQPARRSSRPIPLAPSSCPILRCTRRGLWTRASASSRASDRGRRSANCTDQANSVQRFATDLSPTGIDLIPRPCTAFLFTHSTRRNAYDPLATSFGPGKTPATARACAPASSRTLPAHPRWRHRAARADTARGWPHQGFRVKSGLRAGRTDSLLPERLRTDCSAYSANRLAGPRQRLRCQSGLRAGALTVAHHVRSRDAAPMVTILWDDLVSLPWQFKPSVAYVWTQVAERIHLITRKEEPHDPEHIMQAWQYPERP